MTPPLEVYAWKVSIETGWRERDNHALTRPDGRRRVVVVHEELEGAMGKALQHLEGMDPGVTPEWMATHERTIRVVGVKRLTRIDAL